jgi:hypothetical protein
MQKYENIIRLHYTFIICFCHLQVFMWYSQSDDIYRETYGFCCTNVQEWDLQMNSERN